jgi:serine/threonine-protein kinase
MASRERLGKFVLLEEVGASALGPEYRAAKLGPAGLEKIVNIVRLRPALCASADVAKSLLDQVKAAAQIQNPNVVKISGIGKVDSAYYISYEFLESKSLKAILKRCRQESFPFSVDHALLIASKACSALEQAHARRSETGSRYFHGLVTPDNVVVTYEGEVRVRGFGYWPSKVRESGGVDDDDRRYLAPEQAAGGFGDTRSDTFSVGALLYEMLTGQPLLGDGRAGDPAAKVAQAKQWNPASDDDSLAKPIAEILRRALAADPAARYGEIQEMRKAVDTLLFSGDFTPTTFNLAFFMHSLFRDDIERESRRLKEEREASYVEAIAEEAARPSNATSVPVPDAPASPAASPAAAPAAPPTAPAPAPATAAPGALPLIPPPPRTAPVHRTEAHPAPSHTPASPSPEASAGATAREAASGFTFHKKEDGKKKPTALVAGGIAAAVLVAAAGGWLLYRRSVPAPPPPTPPPSTLSAEAVAAMQRVKELEEKLKAIEEEKAAAEAKAAEEAKKKLEAQAAARGQKADTAAVERAQEEARRKAQLEQERKAQEEKKRLEDEQKQAEARLVEERRRAEEEARVAAAASAAPSAAPSASAPPATVADGATPAPVPALKPGALVSLSDPGVIAPVTQSAPSLRYPPIAERQRVEGTVELSILVDEKGNVIDAKVVTGAGGKSGLNEAAVENVKRRHYRPATKDGVPVRVWCPVSVRFVLPRF